MAKDVYHNTVRTALQKDGWTITDDPLTLKVGGRSAYIDLGAEKLLAAEKEDREHVTFASPHPLTPSPKYGRRGTGSLAPLSLFLGEGLGVLA